MSLLVIGYCCFCIICYRKKRRSGTFRHEKQSCCPDSDQSGMLTNYICTSSSCFHFFACSQTPFPILDRKILYTSSLLLPGHKFQTTCLSSSPPIPAFNVFLKPNLSKVLSSRYHFQITLPEVHPSILRILQRYFFKWKIYTSSLFVV